MKTKLIYLFALLAISFTACDKTEDGEDKDLTKEQADAAINSMADDMSGDIAGIMDTEGGAAIESLATLFGESSLFEDEEGGRKKKEIRKTAQHLYRMFVPSQKIAGRSLRAQEFIFEEHTGVYDYNFDLEDFEKTGDSDVIEINFPTEGSASLNGQLVISALDIIEYTYSDEWGEYTDTYPTNLVASLKVDNVEQASIDMEIAYNDDFMPVSADVAVFVNPYSFAISFTNTNSSNASFAASIKKGSETIAAVDVDVVKDGEEDIKSANGFVQYRSMKLQGSITNPDYMNPEPESANDFIKLTLYQNSSKVGDIKFFTESDEWGEYEEPYLVYNDGTKKSVEEVMEPVLEALEEELEGIFGEEEEGGRKGFRIKK